MRKPHFSVEHRTPLLYTLIVPPADGTVRAVLSDFTRVGREMGGMDKSQTLRCGIATADRSGG